MGRLRGASALAVLAVLIGVSAATSGPALTLPSDLYGITSFFPGHLTTIGGPVYAIGPRHRERALAVVVSPLSAIAFLRQLQGGGPAWSESLKAPPGTPLAESGGGAAELALIRYATQPVVLVEIFGGTRLGIIEAPSFPPAYVVVGNVAFWVDSDSSGRPLGGMLADVSGSVVSLGGLGEVTVWPAATLPPLPAPSLPLVEVGHPLLAPTLPPPMDRPGG